LILGDTNSCLAAIAAKRQKIPIFHMEAGNRCFDQRVPEEINRKIPVVHPEIPAISGVAYVMFRDVDPDGAIRTCTTIWLLRTGPSPRS
jgi:proline racemase